VAGLTFWLGFFWKYKLPDRKNGTAQANGSGEEKKKREILHVSNNTSSHVPYEEIRKNPRCSFPFQT
jgi:hypothetical protein